MADKIYTQKFQDFGGFKKHRGIFGVELELEGVNFQNIPGWTSKAENSLRGGIEYVLPEPVSAKELFSRLDQVNSIVGATGMRLRHSPRASTHIHRNILHETPRTVFCGVTLWTLIEEYVLSTLPGNRSGNVFCLSAADTGDLPDYIEDMVMRCQSSVWMGFPDRGKYAGLNLKTLQTFGSLEFRVFPDAVVNDRLDIPKIMEWASIVNSVIEIARTIPNVTELIEFINKARTSPEWCIIQFGLQGGNPDLIQLGAEEAYEVALAIRKGEAIDIGLRNPDPDPEFDWGDEPEPFLGDEEDD